MNVMLYEISSNWQDFIDHLVLHAYRIWYAWKHKHICSFLLVLFEGLRQFAIALLWLPVLLVGTIVALAYLLVVKLLPFFGVGFMFWIGYGVVCSLMQSSLPDRPAYPGVHHSYRMQKERNDSFNEDHSEVLPAEVNPSVPQPFLVFLSWAGMGWDGQELFNCFCGLVTRL